MENLKCCNENEYFSKASFNAEDSKPFEFKICVNVIDLNSACGDKGYLVIAQAAKLPKYVKKDKLKDIADSCCIPENKVTIMDVNNYGLYAPLDNYLVKNKKEVKAKLKEIDSKIPVYGSMCGFYFDQPSNRIGNTGWDLLNGIIG